MVLLLKIGIHNVERSGRRKILAHPEIAVGLDVEEEPSRQAAPVVGVVLILRFGAAPEELALVTEGLLEISGA